MRTLWLTLALCLLLLPSARGQPLAAPITRALHTRTAAYRLENAPTAVVHLPAGFDARAPLHVVVYLHGFRGCAQVLASRGPARCRPGDAPQQGWDLAGHHDAAGTNTLLVVPQLAFMKRSGRPGCFARQGCFRRFLEEVLAQALPREHGGKRALEHVSSITLVAHSAGYEAALAILERGEVSALVRAVVLMDALYAGTDRYARWLLRDAQPDARLLSLHLGRGGPERESRRLLALVRRGLGRRLVGEADVDELPAALARRRLVVARARPPHRLVPEHHLAQVLQALGLPRRR